MNPNDTSSSAIDYEVSFFDKEGVNFALWIQKYPYSPDTLTQNLGLDKSPFFLPGPSVYCKLNKQGGIEEIENWPEIFEYFKSVSSDCISGFESLSNEDILRMNQAVDRIATTDFLSGNMLSEIFLFHKIYGLSIPEDSGYVDILTSIGDRIISERAELLSNEEEQIHIRYTLEFDYTGEDLNEMLGDFTYRLDGTDFSSLFDEKAAQFTDTCIVRYNVERSVPEFIKYWRTFEMDTLTLVKQFIIEEN